jgi:hypothetical protein
VTDDPFAREFKVAASAADCSDLDCEEKWERPRSDKDRQQDAIALAALNVDLIDKVIAAIEAAAPETVMMDEAATPLPSGRTAYCVVAWAAVVVAAEAKGCGVEDVSATNYNAVGLLNPTKDKVLEGRLGDVMLMRQLRVEQRYWPPEDFDRLYPQLRKEIVLAVLKKFRATGQVDWWSFAAPHMSPILCGRGFLYPLELPE